MKYFAFIAFVTFFTASQAFSLDLDHLTNSEGSASRASSAHAIERALITPDNSTTIYYLAAQKAYNSLKNNPSEMQNLWRIHFSYKHNILNNGFHPGIPEKLWSERGSYKKGNQTMLEAISRVYLSDYILPDEMTVHPIGSFDGVDYPFITYGELYYPHRGETLTEGEKLIIEAIKEEDLQS